jgi:hypothetical protein
MNLTRMWQPKGLLAVAVVVAAAACSASESVVPADHGRVRFVLGGDEGPLLANGPVEVNGTGIAGLSEPDHGPDSTSHGGGDDRPEHRRYIKAANVTFSSILARNLDGVLENVDVDLPVTVDVLTLDGGREVQLPEGVLPEGTYDQAVVVMTQVQVTLWNDTEITIDPPGGGWTAIAPLCPPVEVTGSEDATVSLTLEVRKSFLFASDRFFFAPRFKHPLFCPSAPEPEVE